MISTPDNQWYYQREEFFVTPSAVHGLPPQVEKESRHKGISFIMVVGMHLKLPQLTMATAALFFQRFYMRRSFKEYKYYASEIYGSIYLGRRCDMHLPCQQNRRVDAKEYRLWKDTIIYTEELLLETLCFDLSVEHPYHFLLILFAHSKDAQRGRKLKQVAWGFVNDSLRTTLCLTNQPKIVALAAVYIAGKWLDENLNDLLGDVWRENYEPHANEVQSTSNIIEDAEDMLPTDISERTFFDKIINPVLASFVHFPVFLVAAGEIMDQYLMNNRNGRSSLDKMPPGSKPGSEYQENGTPMYSGYMNSPAKLATPVYGMDVDRPTNGDRPMAQ
ncbi:hypothetical protein BGX23_008147 [Mortierella sp. AD031]|nr:hypothetical protein BGX23_008147 [Mortierella sp. AD031]